MIILTNTSLALSENPTIGDLAVFMLYGTAVVLGTLCFLALVTHLVGKLFIKYSPAPVAEIPKAKVVAAVAPAPAPVVQEEKPEEIPPEVLAVISAAMNEVLESGKKKVNLRPKGIKDWSWSHSGRSSHHSSHKLR